MTLRDTERFSVSHMQDFYHTCFFIGKKIYDLHIYFVFLKAKFTIILGNHHPKDIMMLQVYFLCEEMGRRIR